MGQGITYVVAPCLADVSHKVSLVSILCIQVLQGVVDLLTEAHCALSSGSEHQHDLLQAEGNLVNHVARTLALQTFQPGPLQMPEAEEDLHAIATKHLPARMPSPVSRDCISAKTCGKTMLRYATVMQAAANCGCLVMWTQNKQHISGTLKRCARSYIVHYHHMHALYWMWWQQHDAHECIAHVPDGVNLCNGIIDHEHIQSGSFCCILSNKAASHWRISTCLVP